MRDHQTHNQRVAVTDWRMVHEGPGVDRVRLRVEFDAPLHPRLASLRTFPDMAAALAQFLDDRTKPRWRRILDAVRTS